MSVKNFLDDLLTQGKSLAQKGENFAASKLGFDDSEADRKKLRNTALAGGLIGLLMGSRGTRRLAGRAAMIGGIAYLGKLAFDAYRGQDKQAQSVDKLEGAAAETRARAITSALIAAARADGHIDEAETAAIEKGLAALPADVAALVRAELSHPLDVAAIAALADSAQAGREIYAASLLVCGGEHPSEASYLASLAAALKLSVEEIATIEGEVRGT